jgi:hypothetical protein
MEEVETGQHCNRKKSRAGEAARAIFVIADYSGDQGRVK